VTIDSCTINLLATPVRSLERTKDAYEMLEAQPKATVAIRVFSKLPKCTLTPSYRAKSMNQSVNRFKTSLGRRVEGGGGACL